ncbi:TetR/AcrR family transcriptional regulator [Amycolatopsis jejuensis]|uniref:TetR/AcrR family transcriptional regulator n=1 Tax=Amycolatopsis jejuensis TaxID=330084 RepID=UPI000526466A|nr:TetR/AcrR family transcriptional regulator [Amycolatopsis jejuensis]
MPEDKVRRRSRSARSIERRHRITAIATQQITEHGFENLSVNDLAAAVGMSVGGIYRYITTKTDLLVMACEDIYDGVRDELGGIAAGSEPATEKLRAAIESYLRTCWSRRAQIAMVYREYRRLPLPEQQVYKERENAIASIFADLVGAGMRSGEFRPVNARMVATDIVFLGHLPSFKWWALREAIDSDELCREQTELFLRGLRND